MSAHKVRARIACKCVHRQHSQLALQASVPFSEETCTFIDSLNPDHDLALLRERGIVLRPDCVRIFKAANLVLKKACAQGLSAAQAADIMERRTMRKSVMEKMHKCVRLV